VKAFRDRNYRVVANSRSIGPSNDPDVLAVPGDISKLESARQIVEQGLSRFGRIDSLVNNAGIFIGKKFTDYTGDRLPQHACRQSGRLLPHHPGRNR
jgi:NAD(P)-dependent dehydrogenase (short-subunit alcohol dehydrogenase family)